MQEVYEYVFEHPPFQECHASTLIELGAGDFMVSWFAGTKEANDDVGIWGARRIAGNWETPVCLVKVNDTPHWNPVLHKDKNGIIHLFFKVGYPIKKWETWVMRSGDLGTTWSEPEELVKEDVSGGRGPVKNKLIELSNGDWLAPASLEDGYWQVFVDRSSDLGKTWAKSETVPFDERLFISDGKKDHRGVIQPTLWESEPGQVHMLLRSTNCFICRSDSNDFGKTWNELYNTELPNNNSGIDVEKLVDGRLALIYNPIGKDWGSRYPVSIAVSSDNGSSWERCADLESTEGEFSYPAIINADGGKIAICYTWKRKTIAFWYVSLEDIIEAAKA